MNEHKYEQWNKKLNRCLSDFIEPSKQEFIKKYIFHYTTNKQKNNEIINLHPEQIYLKKLYEQYKQSLQKKYQTPSETFKNNKITNKPCKFCKQTKTIFQPLQKRSPDEPTNYMYFCESCNKSWVE